MGRGDKPADGLAGDLGTSRAVEAPRRAHDRERGQVMVEFSLILLPLALLVVGIVQFGIGLNYWLDLNRLANEGARWAAVNEYPGCSRTDPSVLSCGTSMSLQRYLACQPVADSLMPTVTITLPSGPSADNRGDPVRVAVKSKFDFVPIVGIGEVTLEANATMRIEQDRTRYAEGPYTPPACP